MTTKKYGTTTKAYYKKHYSDSTASVTTYSANDLTKYVTQLQLMNHGKNLEHIYPCKYKGEATS